VAVAISATIDPASEYAWARADGTLTFQDLVAHLTEDVRASIVAFDEVIDASTATTSLTAGQVRALAFRIERLARHVPGRALAIVATTNVTFGMARMFQAHCAGLPIDVGVFRDTSDAVAWIQAIRRSRAGAPVPG
jgi:hypothetical protein